MGRIVADFARMSHWSNVEARQAIKIMQCLTKNEVNV
jgi:hypothetical protein